MLVVILNFFLEGSVMAHFGLICTRIGIASVPSRAKEKDLIVEFVVP